jgi:hypothetical protein
MRYSSTLPALLFALGLSTGHADAQTSEDSVKSAVNMLFTGMKTSNAELIRRSFTDSAILQTIASVKGKEVIQTDKVEEFASVIAKLAAGDADERIQFDVIRIDASLAIVWAPYEFYYKGKYSHKGVDSFQLVRVNGVWKIQYLIDTRRK